MLKQVIAGDLRGAQGNTGSLVTIFVSDCLDESSNIFVANLKKAAATGTWSVQQKLQFSPLYITHAAMQFR